MSKQEGRFEPKKLNKVLEEIVTQKQLKKGLTSVKVSEAWGKVMGEHIQQYTQSVRFHNGILYVAINSAPLKMELTYGKEKMIKLINEHLENPLIEKIIFH